MTLSNYEHKEWDRLQKRKASKIQRKSQRLVPAAARDRVSDVVDAVKETQAFETASEAYAQAAKELGHIIGAAATHTAKPSSVIEKFQGAGFTVEALADIKDLDLEVVDSVVKFNRVRYGHSGTAALSGVASAGAITGAEVWAAKGTISGEGAKKAPGLGVVATAFTADVAATFGLAARTVAATAQYYGYDPRQPEEQVFMMSVLGLGMAAGAPAKTAAYTELSQLTQLLFRSATWEKLNEKVLTRIAQQFATKFGMTLTKKKLGQFVPVAGMAVGGVLNFALVNRIAEAANDASESGSSSSGPAEGYSISPTTLIRRRHRATMTAA
jgi:hypothetical protein